MVIRLVSTFIAVSSFSTTGSLAWLSDLETVESGEVPPFNDGMIRGGRGGSGFDSEKVAGFSSTTTGVGVGAILRPDCPETTERKLKTKKQINAARFIKKISSQTLIIPYIRCSDS